MINPTKEQIKKLKDLWFVYGNGGPKSTLFNHKYIEGFIEFNEDRKQFYLDGYQNLVDMGWDKEALTEECIIDVEKIVYENLKEEND